MSDGAIMELVSRGKKDAYQIQDPVHSWFGSPYVRRSPSTREIRLLYPENLPRFGQWFDVVLPSDGDIITSFDLRITMPTWLPPSIVALNTDTVKNRITVLPDPYTIEAYPYVGTPATPFVPYTVTPHGPDEAVQYGWCNGVANYMIGRWALFVDNAMILDGYGEFNAWFPDMDTTQMQAPLIHAATGRYEEPPPGTNSQPGLQANATLPELVFRLPLPGCQTKDDTGLPLCTFTNQKVYVRFWLLDKTDLVTSGPLSIGFGSAPPGGAIRTTLPCYEICPAPWGGKKIYVNGVDSGQVTIPGRMIGQPYIYARTSVLNVGNELRANLQKQKFEIRFRQQLRDFWTVDNHAFVPGVNYRRLLQINGLFQSLFLVFRSVARTQQNRYVDILPSYGAWLNNLSLNINGLDRILPWAPKVVTTLANNTQLNRDINIALYYLIFGISPEDEPGGACNLSRCQKAALNLTFNPVQVDPMTNLNTTYAYIIGQSWNVLDINEGLALLRFPG